MSDANLDNGGNVPQDGNAPAWTAQLEGDLQQHERLTQFQNISEMGKALLDSEGRLKASDEKMQDALFVPGEDATDEDRAAFYNKLGRPEAPDKYQFGKPEGLPEGVPYDQNVELSFKQYAFESGLTEKQAAGLNGWYHDLVKQGYDQQQKATEEAINSLKDEWKGDAFKENTEIAARAFKEFGGEEAQKFIDEARIGGVALGDHPMFLKVFAEIGKKIGDDKMGDDRRSGHDVILSDEDRAKARFPNTYKKE